MIFPLIFTFLDIDFCCRARALKFDLLYYINRTHYRTLFPDGMDALLDNADALERRPDALALLKPNNPPEKHHRFLR